MKDAAKAEETKNSKYQISAEELLADLPGHIYWKDKDGVVLGCNDEQARTFGFDNKEDMIGKTDYDLLDKEIADIYRKNDLEAMASGKTVIAEEPLVSNGVEYIVLSKKTPLRNKNNEIIGVSGISLDITKRVKAQKEEENKVHYTASLTNIPAEEKDFLKSKSCILPISVGQLVHEGEKFRATLKMVSSYFKKCTIAVNDTLQRYSLSFAHPEKNDSELYDFSYKLGSEWIQRNEKFFEEELKIPYEVVRWDRWLKSSRFIKDLERVKKLYEENEKYKQLVDSVVSSFVARSQKRTSLIDTEICFKQSREYLLEECAAMLQWFDENCDYDLYPPVRNEAISATFELIEPEKSRFLLKAAGIKLNMNTGRERRFDFANLALNSISQNCPGHIYWKNKQGVFLGCNLSQAKNFGFKNVQSILNKTDFDILDYDIALEIRKNDLKVMRSGKSIIAEERTKVRGKDAVYISHKSPLKDQFNNVVGVLGISVDITKQKELEDKLETKVEELNCAIQARDVFLRSVSHEVRTPLSCILRMSNFLYDNWDGYKDNEERKKHLKMAVDGNNRLEKVLVNLLDLSKVKAGRMEYDKRLYSLDQSIKDVVSEFVEHKHRIKFGIAK